MPTLMLDFDTPEVPTRALERRMLLLQRIMAWRIAGYAVYRTRRGWHVTIHVARPARIDARLVVGAQLYLGSDPIRELFNMHRVAQWRHLNAYWRARWNVLYEEHHDV
jgi:hypothetical protein